MNKKDFARLTENQKDEPIIYSKNDVEIIDIIYSLSSDEDRWPELLITLGQCAASLGSERQPADEDELQNLEHKLLPHFERSIRIVYKKMNSDERANQFSQVMNQLPYAFLCVDAQGDVLISNETARDLLKRADIISEQNNKLHIEPLSFQEAFREYQKSIVENSASLDALSVEYQQEETNKSYFLHAYCIQQEPIQFAISIYESQTHLAYFEQVLKSTFRLSKKELEVALELMEGKSAKEIAEKRHVSKVTVKTQMRQIYRKTNSKSQVDFIYNLTLRKLRDLKKQGETNYQNESSFKTISLKSGHNVSYSEYGPKSGHPLFYCHNVFGSRRQVLPFYKVLHDRGIRLIVPERPGYGHSTFSQNRSVLNWVEDLDEILSQLTIDRYSIMGFGAGSNYAAATAARAKTKPEHLVLVSPLPEITEKNIREMPGIVRHSSNLIRFSRRLSMLIMDYVIKRGPYEYYQRLLAENPDIDTLLSQIPDLYSVLIECWLDATRQGSKTLLKEIEIYSKPWEFDLKEIQCPTTIWHGSLDLTIPPAGINDLAASIEHCDLNIIEGETHWIFYRRWSEILMVLSEAVGAVSSVEP